MAKQTLQQQIDAGVRVALARLGIVAAGPVEPGGQTDYVAFGSDRHLALLGLVKVDEGDNVQGFTTFTSPDTGDTYRLDDEMSVLSMYPGVDPEKAAVIVLRQKINVFEGGEPEPPDNAPNMWQPFDGVTMVTM